MELVLLINRDAYVRSVILDAFCKLGNGEYCNIEVQKTDNDNHPKRVRYNASCITANNTRVKAKFIEVPDVTMVYISTFDIFEMGKTIYHCETTIWGTDKPVENGLKEIYVNTAINDGSTIAELMACFMQEQVNNQKFPLFSERVWYFKNDEGGVETMCKIVDDYVNEVSVENLRNLFNNGGSLELAIATFKNVSEEMIHKIYSEFTKTKKTV